MVAKVDTDKYYELWVLLRQTCDAMVIARDNELRRTSGISSIQAAVLFIVKAVTVPATPAEISRWLFRKPHTVSGLLNRMERRGLVRKVKDLERKNMIRIVLTEKGEQACQRSREKKVIPSILSCLSPKERDNLWKYADRLRSKTLEEIGVRYQLPFP
jgi:DNA-binding MarR family transcriptional regulator